MSNYKITQYSKDKIKELNDKLETDVYTIRPSADPKKKIDVLLRNDVIASVGDPALPDYPTYIETEGMDVAKKRRAAFRRSRAWRSRWRDRLRASLMRSPRNSNTSRSSNSATQEILPKA